MAAHIDPTSAESSVPADNSPSVAANKGLTSLFKRLLGKNNAPVASGASTQDSQETDSSDMPGGGLLRRASRRVIPGLPRMQTFKRQQSEIREKLEPITPTPAERRAVSVDRRGLHPLSNVTSQSQHLPRASAPEFLDDMYSTTTPPGLEPPEPPAPVEEKPFLTVPDISTVSVRPSSPPEEATRITHFPSREPSHADRQSITTSAYDAQIHDELETRWILNLSMHFRDKSKREKFFVTYREKEFVWRRVTISLDYRDAPEDSLELELTETKFQRDKSARIYEAIRESLDDIQFYDTVTNLKLQTTDRRLHVHVVEDVNEIIHFPTVRMVQHLGCRRVRERDIKFDSHMSGFVYKVHVDGHTLIKKEIPGPDTVDEFLYEVNALNALKFSSSVIGFYGVVVDDKDEKVKGLLIDYASQGALIDIIYDSQEHGLPLSWETRERWARQIVQGLSDVHEAGFVQGDFTLSNIVIDKKNNAKIIDINRRGCPVGWEPPEATPLIDSNQRISMYIGVKSDLYQLGMVLWALATMEDEPEAHRRPLHLDPEIEVPGWYRKMVENCLHENPRVRLQATALLGKFPTLVYGDEYSRNLESISVDDGHTIQQYVVDGSYEHGGRPFIRTVTPQSDIYYSGMGYHSGVASPGLSDHYPPRGRSPPSPGPSNRDENETACNPRNVVWSTGSASSPSTTDNELGGSRATTPRDGQSVAATEGMDSNLDGTRVRSQESAYRRHSVSETSESIDLTPNSSIPPAPEIVIEPVDEESSHANPENSQPHKQTQARGSQRAEAEEAIALASQIMSIPDDQAERTQHHVDETDEQGDVMDEGIPPPVPMAPEGGLFDGDDDDGYHDSSVYVHNGSATVHLPSTSQVPPPRQQQLPDTHGPAQQITSDLTGIGAGYGTQDHYRQAICSEEDLGITSSTHTNVASQA